MRKEQRMSGSGKLVRLVFVMAKNENEVVLTHKLLQELYQNISSSVELQEAQSLAFLDVLMTQQPDGLIAHNKTRSGQYTHFKSSDPIR